jgi:hypothetical protein
MGRDHRRTWMPDSVNGNAVRQVLDERLGNLEDQTVAEYIVDAVTQIRIQDGIY